MRYLFFDTETNGLPIRMNADHGDTDNWPRVIQLAWVMTNEEGVIISQACDLIKPDGWTIPVEKFWLENGYSTHTNTMNGIPAQAALAKFIDVVNQSDVLIAHNLDFDRPIVGCEMYRYDMLNTIQEKGERPSYCTMKTTTDLCKIPGKKGGYKWPRLEELHTFLFGVSFDGAHDALEDVRATVRCFFELKKNYGLYN